MSPITANPHGSRSPRTSQLTRLALLSILAAVVGCDRETRQITPTTTGTDLQAMPRGRMNPLPFPGSSLARIRTNDRAATTASTVEGPR